MVEASISFKFTVFVAAPNGRCEHEAERTPSPSVKRASNCNLSIGVATNVRFTTNGMCAKNNTHIYEARTSNNRVIAARDLNCCLLPHCEALRIGRSGFPIGTQPMRFPARSGSLYCCLCVVAFLKYFPTSRSRRVTQCAVTLYAQNCGKYLKAGVPKLSLSMYPFSISIDEHAPLNMSAGRIFFQGRVNSGFSRGGPKYFCREGKVAKLDFHHSKLRKQPFLKKCDGKMSNFKILERPWPSFQRPCP